MKLFKATMIGIIIVIIPAIGIGIIAGDPLTYIFKIFNPLSVCVAFISTIFLRLNFADKKTNKRVLLTGECLLVAISLLSALVFIVAGQLESFVIWPTLLLFVIELILGNVLLGYVYVMHSRLFRNWI